LNQLEKQKPGEGSGRRRHRYRKHGGHKKSKKSTYNRISKWAKKNPSKAIAVFSVGVIVLLTVLFYLYNVEMLTETPITPPDKSPVKGILLPVAIVSESRPVQIGFGKIIRSVTLEELRHGYTISPETMFDCKGEKTAEDRTKFILLMLEDRLYINAEFRDPLSDEVAATINKKDWKGLAKNSAGFFSDDNTFQVSNIKGNIIFNMRFNEPDTLLVEGYFSSEKCVYVIGNNTVYSDRKEGNYVEKVSNEIKKLK